MKSFGVFKAVGYVAKKNFLCSNPLHLFRLSIMESQSVALVKLIAVWEHTERVVFTFRVAATSLDFRTVDTEHPPTGISHIRLCR